MELISNLAQPLPPEYFLHKVLVPETSLGLIAEDINKPMISDPIGRLPVNSVAPYRVRSGQLKIRIDLQDLFMIATDYLTRTINTYPT